MDEVMLDKAYQNWTNTYTSTGYTFTYPFYTYRERDKGQDAFNILKALRTKKLLKVEGIDDFIEAMSVIMKEL